MSIAPLNRRTLLQTGACGLAFGALLNSADAASQIAPPPASAPALLSGMLAGWVTVELHESAVIRFAHLEPGAPPVELGAPLRISLRDSSGSPLLDQMRRATTATHQLARAMLARSWNLPVEDCLIEHGHIADRHSGRLIGYSVWVDLA
jgi:hypothetical protein